MVSLTVLGLTQQASVRRGPRASATYLLTVLLAESKASAFFPNRVCVSPKFINSKGIRSLKACLIGCVFVILSQLAEKDASKTQTAVPAGRQVYSSNDKIRLKPQRGDRCIKNMLSFDRYLRYFLIQFIT